jgi:tripartite-type tricarboxylate transporter receptor subunit TctC
MRVLLAALAFVALSALPVRAQSVEEFYKGKTINLAIGFSVGGGYDLYARHLARHMGKHIPGNPAIVPQNMAGAGSLRAANFIYTAAPKDGTGVRHLRPHHRHQSAAGKRRDLRRHQVLLARQRHRRREPLRLLAHLAGEDLEGLLEKPITLGGQGPSSEPDVFARLYKNVFGAPIKLVAGYPGTNEIALAMERGEVDGLCGLSWSTIKTRHAQWLKDKKINLLVQASFKKVPEIGDVPLVMEQTKDTEKLQILKLFLAAQEMARPFARPPASGRPLGGAGRASTRP